MLEVFSPEMIDIVWIWDCDTMTQHVLFWNHSLDPIFIHLQSINAFMWKLIDCCGFEFPCFDEIFFSCLVLRWIFSSLLSSWSYSKFWSSSLCLDSEDIVLFSSVLPRIFINIKIESSPLLSHLHTFLMASRLVGPRFFSACDIYLLNLNSTICQEVSSVLFSMFICTVLSTWLHYPIPTFPFNVQLFYHAVNSYLVFCHIISPTSISLPVSIYDVVVIVLSFVVDSPLVDDALSTLIISPHFTSHFSSSLHFLTSFTSFLFSLFWEKKVEEKEVKKQRS